MKTIMVVDKETSILEEVKTALEEEDFTVITADNSRKALELLEEEKDENFGLILINTTHPDTKQPALFSMNPRLKKNIDTSKNEDFLQKPFTKEELQNFVKSKIISE